MKKNTAIMLLLMLSAAVYGAAPAQTPEKNHGIPGTSMELSETVKVVFYPFREAIVASRIDGVVTMNNLLLGARFKAGEVLIRLDDTRFKVDVERVEALEREAVAQAEFAKEAYAIQQDLFKQNLGSEIELKKAKLDVETSAARLLAVRANLKEARNQLSYCNISVPFSGRIEEIAAREAETIRAAQPILRIIDDSKLKSVMYVPVHLLRDMKIGDELEFYVTDTGRTAKGKVYEISPRADHRSGTIEVRALIENKDGQITSGMTGEFKYAVPR